MSQSVSKVETHPANLFLPNPNYIRVKPNDDHVKGMHDKLQDAKSDWPFPPIYAQAIPASETESLKEGYRYYIIDGHHRVAAARMAGTSVKAIIYSGLSDRDAIALQCRSNIENGLALSNAARTKAVKALAGDDPKQGAQKEIARITGIPFYTVSRILSEKKPPVAGTPADGRTKTGKEKAKSKPFDTAGWLTIFLRTMGKYEKNRRAIIKAKGFPKGLETALDAALDCINPESSTK